VENKTETKIKANLLEYQVGREMEGEQRWWLSF